MTEEIQQILNRKLERRKRLAALPMGVKLHMLEEMVAATKVISAIYPFKQAHLKSAVVALGRLEGTWP